MYINDFIFAIDPFLGPCYWSLLGPLHVVHAPGEFYPSHFTYSAPYVCTTLQLTSYQKQNKSNIYIYISRLRCCKRSQHSSSSIFVSYRFLSWSHCQIERPQIRVQVEIRGTHCELWSQRLTTQEQYCESTKRNLELTHQKRLKEWRCICQSWDAAQT